MSISESCKFEGLFYEAGRMPALPVLQLSEMRPLVVCCGEICGHAVNLRLTLHLACSVQAPRQNDLEEGFTAFSGTRQGLKAEVAVGGFQGAGVGAEFGVEDFEPFLDPSFRHLPIQGVKRRLPFELRAEEVEDVHSARKFRRRFFPSAVRIDSGWN